MQLAAAEVLKDKEYYMGSDGSLEHYPQIYKTDDESVETADLLEQYIIEQQETIKYSFLKIGAALIKIEDEQLYLAKGVPSFAAYLKGPQFEFSYEHGTRMMRIVRDLVPILGDEGLPPISTLKELLPLVAEGKQPEEIKALAEEVSDMTTQDAKQHIRESRGIERAEMPTLFRARVQRGEVFHRVRVDRTGEDGDMYELTDEGPLKIKPKDWARWADRFGEGFIQYE